MCLFWNAGAKDVMGCYSGAWGYEKKVLGNANPVEILKLTVYCGYISRVLGALLCRQK